MIKIIDYEIIGAKIGRLVNEKQKVYGDSFNASKDILKILYPESILPDQYGDMLAVVRIIDKLKRIATNKDKIENPYEDIAGYGLLGTAMKPEILEPKQKEENRKID